MFEQARAAADLAGRFAGSQGPDAAVWPKAQECRAPVSRLTFDGFDQPPGAGRRDV